MKRSRSAAQTFTSFFTCEVRATNLFSPVGLLGITLTLVATIQR